MLLYQPFMGWATSAQLHSSSLTCWSVSSFILLMPAVLTPCCFSVILSMGCPPQRCWRGPSGTGCCRDCGRFSLLGGKKKKKISSLLCCALAPPSGRVGELHSRRVTLSFLTSGNKPRSVIRSKLVPRLC